MARITVTDCLGEIDNRFQLVLIAARRTRQLIFGAEPRVEDHGEKPTVLALREIAAGKVGPEILEEDALLPGFTRFNEVENPFPEYAEYTGSAEIGAPDPFAGESTDGTAEEALAAALAQAAAKLGIDPPDAAAADASWPEAESAAEAESKLEPEASLELEPEPEPEPEAAEAQPESEPAPETESEPESEPEPEPEPEPAPEAKNKAGKAAGKSKG